VSRGCLLILEHEESPGEGGKKEGKSFSPFTAQEEEEGGRKGRSYHLGEAMCRREGGANGWLAQERGKKGKDRPVVTTDGKEEDWSSMLPTLWKKGKKKGRGKWMSFPFH